PAASSLRVLRTSWHPRPEKRVAWVQAPGAAAPQAVHEGDRVEGWLVREIEPAAVVLSDGAGGIRRDVGSPEASLSGTGEPASGTRRGSRARALRRASARRGRGSSPPALRRRAPAGSRRKERRGRGTTSSRSRPLSGAGR